MKYYLNNDELKTMKEVENITHTDYEIEDNFIKTDYLVNAIDELLREIYRLNQEYKDLKRRYWGQHLWARGYFCATVGSVTEEMIRNYIANQGNDEKDEIFKIEDEFQS